MRPLRCSTAQGSRVRKREGRPEPRVATAHGVITTLGRRAKGLRASAPFVDYHPEPRVASSTATRTTSLALLPHVPQPIGADDERVVLGREL